MANILILGGGFGGLIAAEELSQSLGGAHQITLVSRSREFVFYPALVQVAFGECEPKDISFDLQPKLSEIGVRFVEGKVIHIDSESCQVSVAGDDFSGELFYDYLVIAFGRRLAVEKIPGLNEYAHHLLKPQAALEFRESVRAFNEGQIVVGMCPDAHLPVPVCETAFALARMFENEIDEKKVSISVIFPASVDKALGGAKLSRELEWAFEMHDISMVTDFPICEITAQKVSADDDRTLNYDLLMLVPPFRGQELVSKMGELSNSYGYAKVNRFMRLRDSDRVYAVGDITNLSGPKLAQMAVRQAKVAAANIVSEISGKSPSAEYHHEIATIIDQGGPESIYLHYGIWDKTLYRLQSGTLWSWIKSIHDKAWQKFHS